VGWCCGCASAGVRLTQLDLGGGLGIAYTGEEATLDVAGFGAAVTAAARSLELELLLEPGRFLVGNAGVLLTRVIGRKRGEAHSFAIVDAAMNDLIRPALYGAYHPIVPVRGGGVREARCAWSTWSGRCASAVIFSGAVG
jgi:diaminopimelate decarboxylase